MKLASRWLSAVALALALSAPQARAADYVLGTDDELSISVWLHPEMEKRVTIGKEGSIAFPPIGEVAASGLTPKQLGDRLADRLSAYLRQTTSVTVTVTRFMSHSIYVTGAVNAPGRYGFEEIPDLLTVITTAGGAVPGSDLTRVQLIRREGEGKGTRSVDVLNAQRTGDITSLPKLMPGDVLFLQSFVGAYAAAPGDGFAVLGEVQKPGIYQAGPGTNAWMALALAGGTTKDGDLAKVKIVNVRGDGQQVSTIDLQDVLARGASRVVEVKPGDVLYVSRRGATFGTVLTQALALSRDLVNVAILVDYLDNKTK